MVDEETFVASKYRVMALLKEAHDENKIIPDWSNYMNYIRDEAKADRQKAHWNNLNYWIEALYNGEKSFTDCTKGTFRYDKNLNENMLKVAVVNIKKILGKPNSDDNVILKDSKDNKSLLLDEISIIAPKLVLCGGTYASAKEIFKIEKDEHLPCGLPYFVAEDKNYHKMFFLDFLHPSIYSIRACMLYTFARVAFSEAKDVMSREGIV